MSLDKQLRIAVWELDQMSREYKEVDVNGASELHETRTAKLAARALRLIAEAGGVSVSKLINTYTNPQDLKRVGGDDV